MELELDEGQRDAVLEGISHLESATSRNPTLMGRAETDKLRRNLAKLCGVELGSPSATDTDTSFKPTVTESPLITDTDKRQEKLALHHI